MTAPSQLIQALRQFVDVAMHWTMRDRVHFAKTTGLSLPQFGILMQLHHRGDCGISDISERFDITAPAASQLVDKLVQAGLIERTEDPDDRRVKQIALSSKGRLMIETGSRERYRWMDKIVKELDPIQRDKVLEALTILNQVAVEQEKIP
jgi:DNA-binding MarR family transcriptional regulator